MGMLMQDLNAQISQATRDRDEKAETKAKKLQAKADALGDLKDTMSTRAADAKYLADLTATCEQKASDFESRQQSRAMPTSTCLLCCRPRHSHSSALILLCRHRPV